MSRQSNRRRFVRPTWQRAVAFVTLTQFLWSLGLYSPRVAHADEPAAEEQPIAVEGQGTTSLAPAAPTAAANPAATVNPAATSGPSSAGEAPASGAAAAPSKPLAPDVSVHTSEPTPGGSPEDPKSLPTGADKTGVSSQAISLPQGTGKIQGMGESFSAQLSTGIATYTLPISLPSARGAAQPSLSVSYSSSGGHGVAGVGWEIGAPFVARQTDRGVPKYGDPPVGGAWMPNQDRFVFNGGQELVPICRVKGAGCDEAVVLPANEVFPTWVDGWQYFRPRIEGSFLRFFWSKDHKTWLVQSKTGETMELGVPRDSSYAGALETDPADASRVFRWNIVRHYDAQRDSSGNPVNIVAFRYFASGGMAYLSDIYDTPPRVDAGTASLSSYAHHVRLRYESRTDPTFNYRRGWAVAQLLRLSSVDVTSKTFTGGTSSSRALLRRYRFGYDGKWHPSLLTSFQLEGRCTGDVFEDASEGLPATSCPRLPAMTFDYQHVVPYDGKGSPGVADLPGYEGFDERLRTITNSPPYSLDEELTDLFDVNTDALPDVLVTAGASFHNNHGVFFNGGDGSADKIADACEMPIVGVGAETATTITLKNLNVAPGDVDGDARIDLLHMPKVKTYSVYTPRTQSELKDLGVTFPTVTNGCPYALHGRAVNTASTLAPKIDFGKDATDIHLADVNGDGLVDVVYTAGTEVQTFFSLGRYQGGDGQFGDATWASDTTATISNDPIRKCVPWSGTPVRFSDAEIRFADMNGDGLPDIVKIRKGNIQYWPGRGNGFWGTGSRDDCAAGTFGTARSVDMTSSPSFTEPNVSALRLDDVNGDGLDDLVQVRFTDVDVWLNVDGVGWTDRHTLAGTPAAPSYASRVRLVDVNGSGTRDVLWGDGLAYKYIDLLGGKRPWVLTKVSNGLGKTTELEYASSTELMLAAQKSGAEWGTKTPSPMHVVVRETTRDHIEVTGRPGGVYVTEYSYANPVYDGLQREFRGFKQAWVKRIGDANGPTAVTSSTFLLGECVVDGVTGDACTPQGRWKDQPYEALKGLPVFSETYDLSGTYLSSIHHKYTLRTLYRGLDGRAVKHAFESATDTYLYDTGPFVGSTSALDIDDVVIEPTPPPTSPFRTHDKLKSTAGRAHLATYAFVDKFGNKTEAVDAGCVDGCVAADEVIHTFTEPSRPDGDTSGWLFRTTRAYVTGSATTGNRNEKLFTYDSKGNLKTTQAVLWGVLPLDRFHEDPTRNVPGVGFAPAPPTASAEGTITLSQTVYDELGNAVFVSGANNRCRAINVDSDYADLTTTETIYGGTTAGLTVGGTTYTCGTTALTTSATYDRGLEAVVTVKDLHEELSQIDYDGFGRTTKLWKPDPENPKNLSGRASVEIQYLLTSDPVAQPWSLLHTRNQDGATPADDSYRESWAYVDGLGRTIATLDEADPLAGDGGDWVVNLRDPLVRRTA